MNGIIHNCTHKDSDDVHFRLTEEEMFIAIFNYIEHLFSKIKPKKLFFMAVDGVAPRAKMNQQRARRFRTALDAEKAREKAIREGKELPKEEPFDSNCITPGTEFMAKLSQQLKYFINKKVSEDRAWQQPEIVLSGHEVPGEGEHKIMEYIRNARAQPDYSPNVRHCLYGLDADLIMLGLLSHDPHFCLLREEVTFGRQAKHKSKELEHQNFYLLHLCIVREYLELDWLRGKRMLENDEAERQRAKAKGKLIVSSEQKALWKKTIRKFLTNQGGSRTLDLGAGLNAADRKFVQELAEAAHLEWATKPDDEGHRHLILSYPARDEEDEEDEEAQSAVLRIVKKYDNAQVIDLTSADAKAALEANLATLPYSASLGFHGVNVFQQDSRNESMVVSLLETDLRTNVESAKVKLGQRCFVGYPFLQEAKIVKVSDELFDYTLADDGSGRIVTRNHAPREIEEWTKKADRIENFYSKRLGILIGPVESLVSVHMLKGLIKTDEGATVKEYGEIPGMETEYASQIIVDEVVNEDERFIEKAALPVEEEFPVQSTGFFLGEYNYGQPLEVAGHSRGKLSIWLAVLERREPEFAKKIIHDAQRGMHYLPSYMVAKQLDLHPLTLSKITSSYYIRTVGDLRVNLGLNLKFDARKQKVLGYSRKSETGWEFSPAAVHLIVEYMTRFPDFFAGVKRNPSGAELKETDLWGDPTVASARVKEIGAWLKTLKTSSMERVPLDAEQLDSDVVMRLATEADRLQLSTIFSRPKKMNGVPRNALMRPEDAEHRLGNQRFSLGDRVVYVARTGKVPIGFRGTVVGISHTPTAKLLDVVFDVTFMSGNTLGGRCPPFRGQTVPSTTLLNLSNHQVVAGSKAQVARQPVSASVTTLTAHGGYHLNGKRYQDAAAPPPLQASFRSVVNGAARGGRGGGGGPGGGRGAIQGNLPYRAHQPQRQQFDGSHVPANNGPGQAVRGRGGASQFRGRGAGGIGSSNRGRGGYPGPVGVNPNGIVHPASAPPMYAAVPPPSSLDAPRGGRGRGRGGARGRGDGPVFRGRGRGARQQQTAALQS
ncbi:hypothetical protein MYCTH_92876 [Thermothelomyces thermophilus ATCC 42464]|uniref:Uncharacterized protein n=1 Tax=Thermothelomyces thermophilus (strain ATCC 42464 / BCRC 31852 / DSM 1799) TaxID=573729 RepID=G2Q9H6_THET4|nr:uncharacterized protein MYCTH_92876 [Thermothelomyces thermophilus ATCC 42464]AEO56435.1 hypothetical protein MYCTH_92876 [Thermothelomyces thermophilus ATCC 42464]